MASGDSFSRASVARPREGGHSQAALHRRAHACPDEMKFGCAQTGTSIWERLNGHYGASAFVVSNTFASAPYLFLISLIPGVISCYLLGLQKGLDHYVCYMLVLFACMMLVESLMMIVASLVPNYLMGIIVGAGTQGLMIMGEGFFRLPDDLLGPFWRYPLYYISFHRYAYQGVFKNEFDGLVIPS
ncbi:hypothetical protein CDL15_Pgr008157 [Punica granatum]|uniref:ABC-2 type transporter transmembrane domain-containing protein n=1 Tax=Punica granatum TaxID=22663 RepID=A0A218VST5_PUNGR|nr:hypothetical protein CDL15_Pgr008157 [Punica granatum]